MWQAPWWVSFGLIAGLAASGFMILYWLYSLRVSMVRKGLRYTSHFLVLPWIAIFLTSLNGLLRISEAIELGGVVDVVLLYAFTTLIYVALLALVVALLLDVTARTRRTREY